MDRDSMTQASGSGQRLSNASQRDPTEVHREKRMLRQQYRSLIESTESEQQRVVQAYILQSTDVDSIAEARSNLADHGPLQLSQMIKQGADLYERGA
jgi:DNA integrity scanning protein DisA with diadenylate cyclase activity